VVIHVENEVLAHHSQPDQSDVSLSIHDDDLKFKRRAQQGISAKSQSLAQLILPRKKAGGHEGGRVALVHG